MGRVEDRLGIRMNQNAEIIFEDCRIPKNHLVNELHGASAYRGAIAGGSKTKTATKALGVARAAFEEAVAYPRERVQGAKPIIQHQSVAEELVNMETSIDLHGADEISRGRRIEKLVRDAITTLHIATAGHAAKAVLGTALPEGRHVTVIDIHPLKGDACALPFSTTTWTSPTTSSTGIRWTTSRRLRSFTSTSPTWTGSPSGSPVSM